MKRLRKAATKAAIALCLVLVAPVSGHSQARDGDPIAYGGISGLMRTSNTVHISVEFTNRGDRPVSAFRGRVEILNDFGEVSATLNVELTSRTRKEVLSEDGTSEAVPFRFLPGETIHFFIIEWQDYSNETQYYVQNQEGFEYSVEREFIVPLDPTEAAASRFVVGDIVYSD